MIRRAVVTSLVPLVVAVTTATATSGAVPDPWTPVKANPNVDELHASPHGGSFGWVQSSPRNPEHFNFLVERKDGARVKANAAHTQGIAGDIVGNKAFYLQQLGDRSPRIQRYNLKTGKRTPLPANVNQNKKREVDREGPYGADGNPLTASGPWLLFRGIRYVEDPDLYPLSTAMLYNRVTHKLRELQSVSREYKWVTPGQVNGRYAVWAVRDDINGTGGIERYDIKTDKLETLVPLTDDGGLNLGASVSRDGTVYYVEKQDCGAAQYCDWSLVRLAPDGTRTGRADGQDSFPRTTYVKDRRDGSHILYVTVESGPGRDNNIYRLVDNLQD